MMKRILLICMIGLTALMSRAQTTDAGLSQLLSCIEMLHKKGSGNYQATLKKMTSLNIAWTPMDELGNVRQTECGYKDRVDKLQLNKLLSSADDQRHVSLKTHGDMLNGEDTRYKYSLAERALKPGKAATYELRNRTGRQQIAIVPYNGQKGSVTCSVAGMKGTAQKYITLADGSYALLLEGKAEGGLLKVTVGNKTNGNLSFVIINYNSQTQ